ncbi:MAG: hypothetical protein A3J76_05430 [Candidatus Moranbacteria bacterium RBG_13_45_13]|nr:MAG: hypothetical protein A3J76_05430 [Candidatus Moranbacteria bacterium RBG_13_45_13]
MPGNIFKREKRGFTLIELMVAIFIASIILVAMVAVFVSMTNAHVKSRAIKTVAENAQFALNSIAKDVRMGKIETTYSDGTKQSRIIVARNTGVKVCYEIGADYLGLDETAGDCTVAGNLKKLVNLATGTGMVFNLTNSGFYSCPSSLDIAALACPSGGTSGKRRGWFEANLEILPQTAGTEMETEPIRIQTIVSSRDYGR